jgi:hypothetical protein
MKEVSHQYISGIWMMADSQASFCSKNVFIVIFTDDPLIPYCRIRSNDPNRPARTIWDLGFNSRF